MDTSMILASYVFKAQYRSGRDNGESLELARRNTGHVIARFIGAVAAVGVVAVAVNLAA